MINISNEKIEELLQFNKEYLEELEREYDFMPPFAAEGTNIISEIYYIRGQISILIHLKEIYSSID